MSFNSNNPFLNNKTFSSTAVSKKDEVHQATLIDYNQEMTLSGTNQQKFNFIFTAYCLGNHNLVDGF